MQVGAQCGHDRQHLREFDSLGLRNRTLCDFVWYRIEKAVPTLQQADPIFRGENPGNLVDEEKVHRGELERQHELYRHFGEVGHQVWVSKAEWCVVDSDAIENTGKGSDKETTVFCKRRKEVVVVDGVL